MPCWFATSRRNASARSDCADGAQTRIVAQECRTRYGFVDLRLLPDSILPRRDEGRLPDFVDQIEGRVGGLAEIVDSPVGLRGMRQEGGRQCRIAASEDFDEPLRLRELESAQNFVETAGFLLPTG